ncbi:DUF6461 domain-containing protein [Streptomyces sp. LHD-70]|uniref:DUF6461 domain-containing protein n=1 Tax=Streptomyces sp. LHD-70 TaxID=3072140 RepID=UPI00280CD47E|nr:DUF6461 domain-containing protein [Streptomyces sp. LHD-70]MDQ8705449.1 DUF6461 domain-containing protein [Streptomyces sp. LHD-70]
MPHNPLAWIAEFQMCYSLTLVEGLTASELLDRLGCPPGRRRRSAGPEDVKEFSRESAAAGQEHGVVQAGVSAGWAWALEPRTLLANDGDRLAAASHGTRLISCCYNGNALGYVQHWVDSELITFFDDDAPELRHEEDGSDPDRLVDHMRRVGFRDEPADDLAGDDMGDEELPQFASLALLHAYTGVSFDAQEADDCLLGELSPR